PPTFIPTLSLHDALPIFLRYLAKHQGKVVDESSGEQPGKILHEVRTGEAVEIGAWPHILYGTIDATALFLCALTETENWTRDRRSEEHTSELQSHLNLVC